ncbi:MAG: response regulator [Magnetococcales bacterium]|nr:response regulator [Magnetococcales bacterium]
MRILIADDEPTNRLLLQQLLKAVAQCDPVADGREAVDFFKAAFDSELRYDLVLMDVMMPEMNGHDALASIRMFEELRGVTRDNEAVIILVTAIDAGDDAVAAFSIAFRTDYLQKPVLKENLFRKLREHQLLPGDPS